MSKEPISYLHVPNRGEVSADVETLFQKFEAKVGFLPNVAKVFSLTPEHFLKWFTYYDFLLRNEQSPLSRKEREMIALVVSSENKCEYCLASHSAYLRDITKDAVLSDVLIHNYRRAELSERERALLDFAIQLTQASYEMDETDVQLLRDVGLSDEAIFETAQVAAMFNFTNRLANALGWKPNEEFYLQGR
ncbi:MAG: peroxidase-related enzyme [Trueperaceae bacterium]